MTTRFFLTCALVLGCVASSGAQTAPAPSPAPPAAEPDYPIIRVGVLSYVQYDAELKNRDAFNTFDLTRAYLNVNGQLAKNVRFRFTPDVRRVTDSSLAGTLVLGRVGCHLSRWRYRTGNGSVATGLCRNHLGVSAVGWWDGFSVVLGGHGSRANGRRSNRRKG